MPPSKAYVSVCINYLYCDDTLAVTSLTLHMSAWQFASGRLVMDGRSNIHQNK